MQTWYKLGYISGIFRINKDMVWRLTFNKIDGSLLWVKDLLHCFRHIEQIIFFSMSTSSVTFCLGIFFIHIFKHKMHKDKMQEAKTPETTKT